jgi:parvulin-like peptidyl-prolyl isomerase
MKQLREQNNAPDDAAFERMLTSMGMSVQMMRERMRETITMNRLLSREVGTLPVTEEELRQRYERDKEQFRLPERVHLEHIVLTVSKEPGDADAKLAAARRLAAAARAGSDFKGLIQAEVDAKRGTGGDLGVVAVPDLRSEVRDAVAGLKPGDVSEPFTSSAGVHVVKVLERIPPAHKPFTEVVEELRQRELAERYRTHLLSIVTGLKKRFTVETHPELLTAHK